jgi:hypothetical protein
MCGHVACRGRRGMHIKILVGKPKLGRYRRRLEDNIKMDN